MNNKRIAQFFFCIKSENVRLLYTFPSDRKYAFLATLFSISKEDGLHNILYINKSQILSPETHRRSPHADGWTLPSGNNPFHGDRKLL